MPLSLEEKRGSPLPPIGKSWTETATKAGMPNCPVVIFMGGPGCGKATQCKRLVDRYPGWMHVSIGDSLRHEIMQQGTADDKWGMVSTLVQNGEMAPEDVTLELVSSELKKHVNAPGIILEGFPRTLSQITQYEDLVGRVDLVVIVDCEEKYLQQRLLGRGHETGRVDDNINAVAARIAFFKENTLPAVKNFDDAGKLVVIDGDRDADEICFDLASLFEAKFYAPSTPIPRPPTSQKPASPRPGSTRYGRRPNSARAKDFQISVPDSGRKEGLPECPIVLIMGGPGSGKNAYCTRLTQRFPKAVHISMSSVLSKDNAKCMESGDLVASGVALDAALCALKAVENAEVILLDGFPRNEDQVIDFNTSVGGVSRAIVLDCEEQMMRKNLPDNEATTKRINTYRDNALPVISHYDDLQKLTVINVEKPESEVMSELVEAVKSACVLSDYLEPLAVDCKDLGRVGGLPTCPIITIIGAPGSGHDAQCKKVSEKYGFAHQPVAENDVVSSLVVKHQTAKGIILESYPRNRHQLEEFNLYIGGMDGAIVIDVSEDYAQSKAGSLSTLIDAYKINTLPVLGYFDDKRRLKCVKGERSDDEIFADICTAVDELLCRPRSAAKKGVSYYKAKVSDSGRKPGLPNAKIIAVIGAPKGKTDEFCKKSVEKFPGTIHIQATGLTADALTEQIKSAESAELVLLENFPADNAQLEAFNGTIGGMSGVILIDSTEEAVKASGVEQEFIDQYKCTTVPMLCNYDDDKKLKVVNGEQEEDKIFEEICSAIELFRVK